MTEPFGMSTPATTQPIASHLRTWTSALVAWTSSVHGAQLQYARMSL